MCYVSSLRRLIGKWAIRESGKIFWLLADNTITGKWSCQSSCLSAYQVSHTLYPSNIAKMFSKIQLLLSSQCCHIHGTLKSAMKFHQTKHNFALPTKCQQSLFLALLSQAAVAGQTLIPLIWIGLDCILE